jgi:hypothetical protein
VKIFFEKFRVKTIKCGLKTDKKTDKNRQKPIKLSVPKNKSVGFCRFRNRQNRPTKTDKNRQRGVVGLHPSWESPDSLIPDNWKIVPTSVIAHSCKQHPQKFTKDIVRAKNSADCLEKRKNNTRDNLKHFAVYSHFPPNILGGPDDFIPPSTELTNTCL